jgi:hypothetical protein
MQSIQKNAIKHLPLENIIDLLLNINLPLEITNYLLDRFDNDSSCISKEYFHNLYLQINQTNKKSHNPILERMVEIMECNKIYVDLE